MNPKHKGLLWIAGGIFLAFLSSESIKHGIRRASLQSERKLADALPDPVAMNRVCTGTPQARAAFDKLVARIYPLSPQDHSEDIQIQLLRCPTVNAFAYFGGRIFVYSGLLNQAETPEEIAGVLAHEIEHVQKRHVLRSLSDRVILLLGLHSLLGGGEAALINSFVSLRFSRAQEAEADKGGLERLRKARVDVRGFEAFFEREGKRSSIPPILSDHPSSQNRAELAKSFESSSFDPILTHDEWVALQKICD